VDYPRRITIREVSPRDGLQGEQVPISTDDKVALVDALTAAGFRRINVTSFVSPKAVPQMADAEAVMARIDRRPGVLYDVTVPNMRGLRRAIDAGANAIVIFAMASDAGSRDDVNRSAEEATREAEAVIAEARSAGLAAIGTVSSAFGSPYGEVISADLVLSIAARMIEAGASGLALGDTSGEATPAQVGRLVKGLLDQHPGIELSLHLHDTRGLAMANVVAAMDAGVTNFDGAIGGIGGNPFTRNSAGNLATEDLLSMCQRMGIETGVDLDAVLDVYAFLTSRLGRALPGKVGGLERDPQQVTK
jgi:hydroxymethylglutaryl-CoA lyase